MKKVYTILGIVFVIIFLLWLIFSELTESLTNRISELEATLQNEKVATQKQLAQEKELSEKYKKQYEAYIKSGDFCYNKQVEDDVLKMLGENK
jgi:ABC-type dipeptide/oligopeptide/nickel transport system permease component